MPVDKNNPLRRYQSAPILKELTVTHLNEGVDSLQQLREDYSRRMGVPSGDDGTNINWTIAIVASHGPRGVDLDPDDPSKNVYWLKTQRVKSTVKIGESVEMEDETAPGIWEYVRATNMSEAKTSHALATDETVYVKLYRLQGSSSPGSGHRIFWSDQGLRVAIIGINYAGTGGGGYLGTVAAPKHEDIDIDDAISGARLFLAASEESVKVWNLNELLTPPIKLSVGGHYLCLYWQTESDGTDVYITTGLKSKSCSP